MPRAKNRVIVIVGNLITFMISKITERNKIKKKILTFLKKEFICPTLFYSRIN
ncbi:hypothetical protein FLJC2902T_01030 [Flavobacterium limnosediminis JC2902]|uniref:Uncharacterized protein n=1 Tax=Flavobacterium limnosediminis JC2902 TaxID=1341181 RepID=V6SSK4_9FLAO|nr:hypothetical protein FLJC2902T_01030 [Flavobacterium limnosediminis JC2902]